MEEVVVRRGRGLTCFLAARQFCTEASLLRSAVRQNCGLVTVLDELCKITKAV